MAAVRVFDPDGFLGLQGLAEHPVREDGVDHDGEEDFLGELEQVVLVEGCAGDEGCADALAAVFKFTPIGFLGDEGDVVYHHEVEEAVDELCAVGTAGCQYHPTAREYAGLHAKCDELVG